MIKLIVELKQSNGLDLPPEVLSHLLNQRHPDWVSLSSPYRPLKPLSLQEVHLSTWFSNYL